MRFIFTWFRYPWETEYKYEPVWLAQDPCCSSLVQRDSQHQWASLKYQWSLQLLIWKPKDCNVRSGWCQDVFSINQPICHFRFYKLRVFIQRRVTPEVNCILTSVFPLCIVFWRFGTFFGLQKHMLPSISRQRCFFYVWSCTWTRWESKISKFALDFLEIGLFQKTDCLTLATAPTWVVI